VPTEPTISIGFWNYAPLYEKIQKKTEPDRAAIPVLPREP